MGSELPVSKILNVYYNVFLYSIFLFIIYQMIKRCSSEHENPDARPTLEKELVPEMENVEQGQNDKKKAEEKVMEQVKEAIRPIDGEKNNEDVDSVSWKEMHMAMLSKYQSKYPDGGIQVDQDEYDEEMKELMKEFNVPLRKRK